MNTTIWRTAELIFALVCCFLSSAQSHAQAPFVSPKSPNCFGAPVVLQDFSNTAAVQNGPGGLPWLDLKSPACITEINDYHWNFGAGAAPGSISIITQGNKPQTMLTVKAQGTLNWVDIVTPMKLLPAGNYYVDDSNHATWSRNVQSNYRFFTTVYGICALPATGTSCVSNKFAAVGSGGNPPGPTGPQPCHTTTGAIMILDRPGCSGPVGTPLAFTTRAASPIPIAAIVFGPGPMSSSRFVPGGVVKPIPSSTPMQFVAGGPFIVNNTFAVPAPLSMCIAGKGSWAGDLWLLGSDGKLHGDIDYFIIQGC